MKTLRQRQIERKNKDTFNNNVIGVISLIITVAAVVALFNSNIVLIPGI